MAEALNLEKVISVIMENPALISEISSLVGSAKSKGETNEVEKAEIAEAPKVAETVSVPSHSAKDRSKLLLALKPYLSEKRQGAMDTVIGILDVLHTVKGR